jgi:hypothetical protein
LTEASVSFHPEMANFWMEHSAISKLLVFKGFGCMLIAES